MADLNKLVCVRLPQWVVDDLRKISVEDKRSTSQVIRVIVERYLEQQKEQNGSV